jgi:hypothetical protein
MSNIDEEGATGFRSLLQGYGEARIVLESTENLWIPVYDNLAENHRTK